MRLALVLLLCALGVAERSPGAIAKGDPTNACALIGEFDPLELGAGVYLCSVASKVASPQSDYRRQYGSVTLTVLKAYSGTRRSTIVLPYYFTLAAPSMNWPDIWPDLDSLGNDKLLCVVVPNAEDGQAGTIAGVTEAASEVIQVHDKHDPVVAEMSEKCALYRLKDDPGFATALRTAVQDPRLGIRFFALEMTVTELGATAPDDALAILRSRIPRYVDGGDISEAQGLIWFIRNKFGQLEPWDRLRAVVCRCLVELAQSQSVSIRESALQTLVREVGFEDFRFSGVNFTYPKVRLQDALDAAEKRALAKILDLESAGATTRPNAETADVIKNVHFLRAWLAS